jgi:uncharacterized protein DUF6941
VIQDDTSRQWTVVEAPERIVVPQVPIWVPRTCVYGAVRGSGALDAFYVGFYNPDGGPLAAGRSAFTRWNDLGEAEFGITFGPLRFQFEGTYYMRLVVAGEQIAERRLLVKVATPPPPD